MEANIFSSSATRFHACQYSLWQSLSELWLAHSCNCGSIQPWSDYNQMEHVIHFLMGLNESFSAICGQILSTDPIPPITKVFSIIVQEEKQREVSVTPTVSSDPPSASAVKNIYDNKLKGSKKDRLLCAHYCILGHTQNKCFKLHGYPPFYKKSSKPADSDTASLVASNAAAF